MHDFSIVWTVIDIEPVATVKNMEDNSSESDLENFDLVNFLDSDDDNDIDEKDTCQVGNEVDENIKNIIKLQIQDRLSYKTASNAVKLMNNMP